MLAGASAAGPQSARDCEQGEALFRRGAYQEAQETLWSCVASGAADKRFAHLLAQTYRETKNFQEGIQRLDRMVSQTAKPAGLAQDLIFLRGYLYYRLGDFAASTAALTYTLEADSRDWRAHELLAFNFSTRNLREEAVEKFRAALALAPEQPEVHYQLARLYYSVFRIPESLAAVGKALELEPGYGEAYTLQGLCHEQLGEPGRAAESLERGVALTRQIRRRDEWPLVSYAALLIRQGSFQTSLPLLGQALEWNPQSARAHYWMGRALCRLNRNDEARTYLERALALDDRDPLPYLELGAMLLKGGERVRGQSLLARFEALRKQRAAERVELFDAR